MLPAHLNDQAPLPAIDHPDIMVQVWQHEQAVRPVLSLQLNTGLFGNPDYVSGDGNVTVRPNLAASLHAFGPDKSYFSFRNVPQHPELQIDMEVAPGPRNAMAMVTPSSDELQIIMDGGTVTRFFYIPNATEGDAVPRVETLLSTKLDPGLDPLQEAEKRGTIVGTVKLSKAKI